MKFQLRICINCNKYTLKNICKYCKNETKFSHPAKFSPEDRYLKYRVSSDFN